MSSCDVGGLLHPLTADGGGDLGGHHPGGGAEAGGPAALVPEAGAEGGAGLPHPQPQVGDGHAQHENEGLGGENHACETH